MTNDTDNFEKKLHALSRQTFNAEASELDENVLQRLKQAREMAISQTIKHAEPQTSHKNKKLEADFPAWFSPVSTATAFASIAVISSLLLFQATPQNMLAEKNTASPFDDIALLSSSDEFELYEDIDFYIWLEDEEITPENSNSENIIKNNKNAG